MKPILETSRLSIRQFTPEDKPIFMEIEADERLTKYISRRSQEESEKLFHSILHGYDQDEKLGRWGAFDIKTGEFVGICLLAPSHYDPSFVELGYRLHLKFWGQGLASEMARALVNYGLKTLRLKEIVAVVDPLNTASDRVLLKAGLQPQGQVFWYNEWLPFYKVVREEEL